MKSVLAFALMLVGCAMAVCLLGGKGQETAARTVAAETQPGAPAVAQLERTAVPGNGIAPSPNHDQIIRSSVLF